MARTWLSIHVELIEGAGRRLWPRPGRIFAASRSHTFAALADAIDTAFARWDRSHLCMFELQDDTSICGPIRWEDPPERSVFAGDVRPGRLQAGEQLIYTFDMGDDWTHLCTVGEQRIDPLETLGIIPAQPMPYWGWGEIPDQYGRRTADDDGETPLAPDPQLRDLPPLRPFLLNQASAAILPEPARHPARQPLTRDHLDDLPLDPLPVRQLLKLGDRSK